MVFNELFGSGGASRYGSVVLQPESRHIPLVYRPEDLSPGGKIVWQQLSALKKSTGYEYMLELQEDMRKRRVETALTFSFNAITTGSDRIFLFHCLPTPNLSFATLYPSGPTTRMSLIYNIRVPLILGAKLSFDNADTLVIKATNGGIIVEHETYREGQDNTTTWGDFPYYKLANIPEIVPTAIDQAFRMSPPIIDPPPYNE